MAIHLSQVSSLVSRRLAMSFMDWIIVCSPLPSDWLDMEGSELKS